MAIYFNLTLGISIFYVGIIFTLLSVSSSLFSFLGGYLADKVGRKKTLAIGSFAGFFIYLVISILVLTDAGFLVIIGVFILSSISGALVFPSASALVADVTTVNERNSAYAIYRIMSNIGWAIGLSMNTPIMIRNPAPARTRIDMTKYMKKPAIHRVLERNIR